MDARRNRIPILPAVVLEPQIQGLQNDREAASHRMVPVVKKNPIVTFDGDIVIPAATERVINVYERMGGSCSGFIIVSVVPGVRISVNNGGFRTVVSDMTFDDCIIKSIAVSTDALGSCIIQLHGE